MNERYDPAEHYQGSAEAFLSEKMPLSRLFLPWCIALFSISMIAWAWYSEIDIVSSTRGVIIPNTRLQYIQSSSQNVIDRIFVKEGDKVRAGEVLVAFLQTDLLSEQRKTGDSIFKNRAKSYRLKAMAAYIQDLRPYIDPPVGNPFLSQEMTILDYQKNVFQSQHSSMEKKIDSLEAERKSLELEIELLELLIPKTNDEIKRSTILLEEGIIGRDKLDELHEKWIRQKKEKQIKEAKIIGLEGEIAYQKESKRLNAMNQQHDLESELLKQEQEFRILQEDAKKLDSEIQLKNLISPLSGIVNKIMVHSRGAVVQSGETILSIVPEHSPLEVEAKIMNQDVGFIEEGHTVSVKLVSFNFTRYGKLNGTIRRISPGGVEDPQLGMIYPTIIELANQKIEVDAKVFSLKPGMTVTIDIKTGRRKVADYIIEPFLRYSDEALRER